MDSAIILEPNFAHIDGDKLSTNANNATIGCGEDDHFKGLETQADGTVQLIGNRLSQY